MYTTLNDVTVVLFHLVVSRKEWFFIRTTVTLPDWSSREGTENSRRLRDNTPNIVHTNGQKGWGPGLEVLLLHTERIKDKIGKGIGTVPEHL